MSASITRSIMLEVTEIAAAKLAAHLRQLKSNKAVRIVLRSGG